MVLEYYCSSQVIHVDNLLYVLYSTYILPTPVLRSIYEYLQVTQSTESLYPDTHISLISSRHDVAGRSRYSANHTSFIGELS